MGRSAVTGLPECFSSTRGPPGALRWDLFQLRHLGVCLDGDPVEIRIPAGTSVDVDQLLRGKAAVSARLPSLDDALLAGVRVEGVRILRCGWTANGVIFTSSGWTSVRRPSDTAGPW